MLKGKTVKEQVWNYLLNEIGNEYGVAGLMGNLYAESWIIPNRVEILYLKRLRENGRNYTDVSYTAAVDNGIISMSEFLNPLPGKQYGYGLAQWTSPGRKAGLYTLAQSRKTSIGDLETQLIYLMSELKATYQSVFATLKSAQSVREASDAVLVKFEIPANAESMKGTRENYGLTYYREFANAKTERQTVSDIIEKAISKMETWANDDSHGYDQIYRWGEKGDYDCSSAVISAWQVAGVPVKTNGATYTGNMLSAFTRSGFTDVTNSVDITTGFNMKRGDVLLNQQKHVAMYCGNGMEVEASINERGTATGGTPGDQTGREFLIRQYRNYSWDKVLRYTGGQTVPVSTTSGILKIGSTGSAVKTLQATLISLGYDCGPAGADGEFFQMTDKAVRAFQRDHNLTVDGEVGPLTQKALDTAYSQKVKVSYLVRVSIGDLRIREEPSTSAHSPGFIPMGVYTITEERNADGHKWGKLKSGAGWIALEFTQRI